MYPEGNITKYLKKWLVGVLFHYALGTCHIYFAMHICYIRNKFKITPFKYISQLIFYSTSWLKQGSENNFPFNSWEDWVIFQLEELEIKPRFFKASFNISSVMSYYKDARNRYVKFLWVFPNKGTITVIWAVIKNAINFFFFINSFLWKKNKCKRSVTCY